MSEDLSDVLNNFKKMMNNGNIPDNLKEILGNLNSNNNSNLNNITRNVKNNKYTSNTNYASHIPQVNSSDITAPSENNNSNFNIDLETILKMKTIIDSMNKKDDPRANLLYSLKPYLRESRKKQLDQYVNLLNMTKIADIIKNDKKESNGNAK